MIKLKPKKYVYSHSTQNILYGTNKYLQSISITSVKGVEKYPNMLREYSANKVSFPDLVTVIYNSYWYYFL